MKAKGQQPNGELQDIEADFIQSFWNEANKFHMENLAESNETNTQTDGESNIIKEDDFGLIFNDFSGNMDALLAMAFDSYTSNITNNTENNMAIVDNSFKCYEIYTRFVWFFSYSFILLKNSILLDHQKIF